MSKPEHTRKTETASSSSDCPDPTSAYSLSEEDQYQQDDSSAVESQQWSQQKHLNGDNGSDDKQTTEKDDGGLSRVQLLNLICLVVAFGCSIVNVVLVVGGSGRAILSVGGSEEITTSALAVFYVGSGAVGLLTTRIFSTFGHKMGFLCGSVLALCGSGLGVLAIVLSSPVLVACCAFPLGASYGICYHLRYYCFELVSEKALYMGLVLSGGVLAAFLGPEALLLIDEKMPPQYGSIAVYATIAAFAAIGAISLCMIREQDNSQQQQQQQQRQQARRISREQLWRSSQKWSGSSLAAAAPDHSTAVCMAHDRERAPRISRNHFLSGSFLAAPNDPFSFYMTHNQEQPPQPPFENTGDNNSHAAVNDSDDTRRSSTPQDNRDPSIFHLISRRHFLVPAFIAMLLQFIIAMPGSLMVVVMEDVGYSVRQGVLAVELSFGAQWAPAFLCGKLLDTKGLPAGFGVSVLFMLVGTVLLIFSGSKEEGTIVTWLVGTTLVCLGWAFGFSSSTFMSKRNYVGLSMTGVKRVQAANDLLLFIGVAVITYATGYIYAAAGGGLDGWKVVNYIAGGAVIGIALLFVFDCVVEWRKAPEKEADAEKQQSFRDDDHIHDPAS